jgi:hypothetical protein
LAAFGDTLVVIGSVLGIKGISILSKEHPNATQKVGKLLERKLNRDNNKMLNN